MKLHFRSVLMEIARFMVAYIFLLIGFMMSFIICFADQEAFQNFPGMFIKVGECRRHMYISKARP